MQSKLETIARLFRDGTVLGVRAYGDGRVNGTYLAEYEDGGAVILQKLNTKRLGDPVKLTVNTVFAANFLLRSGDEGALQYLRAGDNNYLVQENGNYWRAYNYIRGAHTVASLSGARQTEAYGRALGDFHARLADFPTDKLYFTQPDRHNTPARYLDFQRAAEAAPTKLLSTARGEILFAEKRKDSCSLLFGMDLPARVTHNDPRVDNVLFADGSGDAVCLIDYDTVMPGLFAFDFGDAVRAVCFECAEDERDLSGVRFDAARFEDFTRGYLSRAFSALVGDELKSLAMGVRMMALESGLVYLTDYLTGNERFPALYPLHNLVRARVAFTVCSLAETGYKDMCKVLIKCAKLAAQSEKPAESSANA